MKSLFKKRFHTRCRLSKLFRKKWKQKGYAVAFKKSGSKTRSAGSWAV